MEPTAGKLFGLIGNALLLAAGVARQEPAMPRIFGQCGAKALFGDASAKEHPVKAEAAACLAA